MAIIAKANNTTTVIKNPKLSVNKLAEYLQANSARRRRILQDAKYPKKYITTMYDEARGICVDFLSSKITIADVESKIESFEKKAKEIGQDVDRKKEAIDLRNSALALRSLLASSLEMIKNATIEKYPSGRHNLSIKDVAIGINPDLRLLSTRKDGEIGAMKLHIIKSSLDDESQKVVSLLTHRYLKDLVERKQSSLVIDKKICVSFDVFAGRLENCPDGIAMRWRQIEAACEEISSRWDSI